MEEEIKIKKSKKMRKLEKKINKLTEKNNITPKKSIEKKITKLEKKKIKLEKWLKIKLPFRILIKGLATWLIIGGVCYGCSYVPVVREIKMVTMAAISYVAPEPVTKVLDVVTLNVGANNNDFEWLKTTLRGYISGDIALETISDGSTEHSSSVSLNEDGRVIYHLDGKEVSEEEYKKYEEDREKRWAEMEKKGQEQQAKEEELIKEVLGTTSADELQTMSIPEILMKIATNSTSEVISKLLDMSNLTPESRQRAEQDLNRALKILKKLNNNQMNELVEIITNTSNEMMNEAQKAVDETNAQMSKQEIEAFNMQFKMYEGTQRGSTVKSLIQTVKASNVNSEYTVNINENIDINSSQTYTVTLQYGNDGRVTGIIIQ